MLRLGARGVAGPTDREVDQGPKLAHPVRPKGGCDRTRGLRRSRALCHLAAELPLAVICLVEIARGWWPTGDDAAIAWRSFDVFSSHTPLVGALTEGTNLGQNVVLHAPGPLQYWLLALPVRIDPAHGALWGATLMCMAAAALAIEGARAAAGWIGGVVVTAALLVLLDTQVAVLLRPVWNPYFGVIWLFTAIATGWAASTGHLRWWPVVVLAGSIAAQCHEIFGAPILALVIGSAVCGTMWRRRTGGRFAMSWLPTGLVVGIAAWSFPLVQEWSGHPGNLSLLWSQAHSGLPTIGIWRGLSALGAATQPIPIWLSRPSVSAPSAAFLFIVRLVRGPAVWGVSVMVILAAIAVVGWMRQRKALSCAAAMALVASVGAVGSLAAIPLTHFLSLMYLDVIIWPIGMAAYLVIAWAGVELARLLSVAIQRHLRARRGVPPSTPSGQEHRATRAHSVRFPRSYPIVLGAVLAPIMALSAATISSGSMLSTTDLVTFVRPNAIDTTMTMAHAMSKVVGPGPYVLKAIGPGNRLFNLTVVLGVGYRLHSTGSDPILTGLAARFVGQPTHAPRTMPIVAFQPITHRVVVPYCRGAAASRPIGCVPKP